MSKEKRRALLSQFYEEEKPEDMEDLVIEDPDMLSFQTDQRTEVNGKQKDAGDVAAKKNLDPPGTSPASKKGVTFSILSQYTY